MTPQEKIAKHEKELEDMRAAYEKLGGKISRKFGFISKMRDDLYSGEYSKFLESTFETANWDYILDVDDSPLTRKYETKEYNNTTRKIAELFGDSRKTVRLESWMANNYTYYWKTLGGVALTKGKEDIFRTVISRACEVFDFTKPKLEKFSEDISKDGHICMTLMTDDLSESGILYLFVNKEQTSFIVGKQTYGSYRDMHHTDNIDDLVDLMLAHGHAYEDYS